MALDLYPARRPGEDPIEYRERRRAGNRAVRDALRGRLAFISSEPVQLPVIGVDSQIDEAVRRGFYRDLKVVQVPPPRLAPPHGPKIVAEVPKEIRIGRTKGETFVRNNRKIDRAVALKESRAARC